MTTVLEILAVAFLAAGVGISTTALFGGLLGIGAGLSAAALVLALASALLRFLIRPERGESAR